MRPCGQHIVAPFMAHIVTFQLSVTFSKVQSQRSVVKERTGLGNWGGGEGEGGGGTAVVGVCVVRRS